MQNEPDNKMTYELSDGGWHPPRRLRKLYWHVKLTFYLEYIGGYLIFMIMVIHLVSVVSNALLGTSLALVSVGAYVGTIYILARIRQLNLERNVIQDLPNGWHLIYRQKGSIIKNSGVYLPDLVDDVEFKVIFSKPYSRERRCLLDKLGKNSGKSLAGYCPKCNYQNEIDSHFCSKCGNKL